MLLTLFAGEPGSAVFGSIHDGMFEGKILSKLGNLYIEKASRYFPQSANVSFHSIVYRESDVEDPYKKLRTGNNYVNDLESDKCFEAVFLCVLVVWQAERNVGWHELRGGGGLKASVY